ncbi:MAG: ATP--guanido phosphotransferase [Clostridia bacterium]|nr:ATP--guanido phosphotransferase [Clostridia bacterium]
MANSPEFIETTVISTRLRLARNLSSYPFPSKLSRRDAEEIILLVKQALNTLDDDFEEYNMGAIDPRLAVLLQEQHLISPALVARRAGAAAFVSPDRHVSVMVNEEDHLREQYILNGFNLYKAYERVCGLDEGLGARLNFAYDQKLGFLTACPSNVGTGMRASVMMFLPALEKSNALKEIVPMLKAGGLTVRGMFGEGTASEGFVYQVSNERTLGLSEKEILDHMVRVTMKICDFEIREREKMLKKDKWRLRDECLRTYGTLTNCGILPFKEMMEGLAKVKFGVALGFFTATSIDAFNAFIDDLRPASFAEEHGLQKANEREADSVRAQVLGRVLPELVVRTD